MKAQLEFNEVSVAYRSRGQETLALSPTSLSVEKGDFLAIVGPSGCGKSTLLKLVCELLPPSSGSVDFADEDNGGKPLRVGMAFQAANLLPWLSVRQNVMLPLKIVSPFKEDYGRKKRGEYRDRVDRLLEQVGLLAFADKQPWELSGGMMQRANLCRALVHDPDLLLLDEPFGALDQFTREELWSTLQDLWLSRKPTVLLVTHDLQESAYLANRICIMSARPGCILEERRVDFTRPRSIETTYEAEFVALVRSLRSRISDTKKATEETSA
ncbi:MAG: ABC transporter ATP-binding protein [Verrucomicrobiota bacterium]